MKEIYICHEYLEKSHFLAIYKYAKENGFVIKDYIVLGKEHIVKTMLKRVLNEHRFIPAVKECICSFMKIHDFKRLENKIIIVGIAPYDYLMNKYAFVFKKNKSVYFTSWQFWDGSDFPRGKIKNRNEFEKILKNNFYSAACVSKITEKQVRAFIPKTMTVNHSIPIAEYKKKNITDTQENRCLFLGRLVSIKNVDYILKYMKDNPSQNIVIDIAGRGPLLEKVEKAEKTDSRIHYLGQLSKAEIKNILHKYKFLLLPSQAEPFGIVLLEALASGVPCVVSTALGPDEIITDNETGFKFDLGDGYKGFEYAVNRAQSIDENSYKIMCTNCLKESERYSEENVFEKWKTILE